MSTMPTIPASRRRAPLLAAVTAVLLSGCAANNYCSGPQPYERAVTIPQIVAPEGMRIPTPSTALKVPDAKTESVTYGFYGPDASKPGQKRLYCLDQPPVLKLQANATP